jgi:hypothetical protein
MEQLLGSTPVSYRDGNGEELWRFKTSEGEFFRDTLGQSISFADEDNLYLTTDSSVVAIDLKSGAQKWSYKFVKPSEFARCLNLLIAENKVVVEVNQGTAPLVCIDKESGDVDWSYPGRDAEGRSISFSSVSLRDDKLLFVASISMKRPQHGYVIENQALDMVSGELSGWPTDLDKAPQPTQPKTIASKFAGESGAPVQVDDLFTGVLKESKVVWKQVGLRTWEKSVFNFDRPRFFTNRPMYRFQGGDEKKFEELLDTKVDIRGKVVEYMESYPAIIVVEVTEITAHEDEAPKGKSP